MKITTKAAKNTRFKNRHMTGVFVWTKDNKRMMWYDGHRWMLEIPEAPCANVACCKSYRAFRRHIKRHCKEVPPGSTITLGCRYDPSSWVHVTKS